MLYITITTVITNIKREPLSEAKSKFKTKTRTKYQIKGKRQVFNF